jgi:putative endonuclease
MINSRIYYIYIMSNQSRTLYIGFTNDIKKRVYQHKAELVDGFTKKYKIDTLVYIESFQDVHSVIAREKQLKHWARKKKLDLILKENPQWRDLSDGW